MATATLQRRVQQLVQGTGEEQRKLVLTSGTAQTGGQIHVGTQIRRVDLVTTADGALNRPANLSEKREVKHSRM